MDIFLEGRLDDMGEVAALGAIAIIVFPLIAIAPDRPVEKISCFSNLLIDPGQVNEPKRRTILFNQIFEGNVMKSQVTIPEIKPFLGKIIGLINEVEIGVFHYLKRMAHQTMTDRKKEGE